MVDSGFLAAEVVIAVSLFIFLGVSLYLFLSNRNQYPIKARAPFTATFSIVISIAIVAFADIANQLSDGMTQCTWINLLLTFVSNCFVLGFGTMLLDLCVAYEAEEWKKKVKEENLAIEKVKLPIAIRIRKFLKGKKGFYVVIGFFVKFIIFWIAAIVSVPNPMASDFYWTSADCLTFKTVSGIDVVMNCVIIFIAFAFVAKNLRKVQDNHYQKHELKWLCVATAIVLLQWIIGTAVNPDIVYGTVGAVFQNQIPAFYTTSICLFMIWWRTHKAKRSKSMKSFTSADIEEKSNFTEKRDSNTSNVSDPARGKSKGNKATIEGVIKDAELLADFQKFLEREFATEELFFVQDVYHFQAQLGQMSEADAQAAAKKIFALYIKETSHLCVNISGTDRRALNEVFLNELQVPNKEKLATVFNKSYAEICNLLSTDKFRRYKLESPKYEMLKARIELQANVPVQAAAVEVLTSPTAQEPATTPIST